MSQIFPRSANAISRLTLIGLALALPLFVGLWAMYNASSANTGVGTAVEQPIPFSHLIHAGRLGLDCRYCHTGVETSSFAGMPATSVCMNCHSQIVKGVPGIEQLISSQQTATSIIWQRVYKLPDYVYFDHSAHVNAGVACESCHGRVDQMSVVSKAEPMTMQWCIDCHRNPAPNLRPRQDVTLMGWHPTEPISGEELVYEYGIKTQHLTDCDTCHR